MCASRKRQRAQDSYTMYVRHAACQSIPGAYEQMRCARRMDRYLRFLSASISKCPAALAIVMSDVRQDAVSRIIARTCTQNPRQVSAIEGDFNNQVGCDDLIGGDDSEERGVQFERDILSVRFTVEYLNGLFRRIASVADTPDASHDQAPDARFVSIGVEALSRARICIDYLVAANQRLVMSIARQYEYGTVDYMDLVQEGNIGLLRAIERFDPSRDTKLSTYALWWVKRAMVYAIARNGDTVRPSVNQFWESRRISRALHQLEITLGRTPQHSDVKNALGLSAEALSDAKAILARTLPLDSPVAPGSDVTHQDRLSNNNADHLIDEIHHSDIASVVSRLLDDLPPRQARILRMRFGIGVYTACTLEEIAQQQGVTRERIRQIEAQAIEMLRRTVNLHLLSECLL